MIKNAIEGWVNIYPPGSDKTIGTAGLGIYRTQAEADKAAWKGRLGPAHFIRHEYEEAEK